MKIMLLCSAFNGLSQRAWIELRTVGHDVVVRLSCGADAMRSAVAEHDPDLIICPFLRERVPEQVWTRYRTIIVHPGPPGDRGPSSLDWAITEAAPRWGVTGLQAVEDMDAGPIWAYRTFDMPSDPVRKSELYNGAVTDAAIAVIHEVVAKASDPSFVPTPADAIRSDVRGRLRPSMRQSDRDFCWFESTDDIVRRIRAADGAPGVQTMLGEVGVAVFDARPGPALLDSPLDSSAPGTVVCRQNGAILVRTGDGSVWIGHLRRIHGYGATGVKLTATAGLADRLTDVPEAWGAGILSEAKDGYREITYRRVQDVGILRFDFYNGAMSTGQCERLSGALRCALAEDTRVLVLEGGATFSNGIHLNAIEAADDPAVEAWLNINAIDDVCEQIIGSPSQLVVASIGGNAGAGGVMMALGADRVVVREGVVLNPHYATMGLFGSEYWTDTLPRRVGEREALRLTQQCLPIGSDHAVASGLADVVLPGSREEFDRSVRELASGLASGDQYDGLLAEKRCRLSPDARRRPLDAHRAEELAEMSRDFFDDRHDFAAARRSFVAKQRPASTPPHLLAASDVCSSRPVGRSRAAVA